MTDKHNVIMQPTGNTASDLAAHKTTRSKQLKRCPSFECLHSLYSEHPSVKSVRPKEVGAMAPDTPTVVTAANESDVPMIIAPPSGYPTPAKVTKVHSPLGGGAGAAIDSTPTTATKTASSAAFALKPSKLPPKMDLGNAYLEAQVLKSKTLAEQSKQEMKVKIMLSLIDSGKTFAEITEYLNLV